MKPYVWEDGSGQEQPDFVECEHCARWFDLGSSELYRVRIVRAEWFGDEDVVKIVCGPCLEERKAHP